MNYTYGMSNTFNADAGAVYVVRLDRDYNEQGIRHPIMLRQFLSAIFLTNYVYDYTWEYCALQLNERC